MKNFIKYSSIVLISAMSVMLAIVVNADRTYDNPSPNANANPNAIPAPNANANPNASPPMAQVDVGDIVANTLNLSASDFIPGGYNFTCDSKDSAAVIVQCNINSINGDSIASIVAKITNIGENVLLDLGGIVKLQVTQEAINALVQNGDAIKADGGLMYLTAQSAVDLIATVIDSSGVIEEAHALMRDETGQIMLMDSVSKHHHIVLDSTLDASASNGDTGGLVGNSTGNIFNVYVPQLEVARLAAETAAAELEATLDAANGGTGGLVGSSTGKILNVYTPQLEVARLAAETAAAELEATLDAANGGTGGLVGSSTGNIISVYTPQLEAARLAAEIAVAELESARLAAEIAAAELEATLAAIAELQSNQ